MSAKNTEVSSHASCRVEYDASSSHKRRQPTQKQSGYGYPSYVSCSGSFPQVGSTLGPFFCLGQLGKGTFSSIHKSVHLSKMTVAAAKVELESFQQSGVLDQEAILLEFLHKNTPPWTVPEYLGYFKAKASLNAPVYTQSLDFSSKVSSQQSAPQQFAALFMEHLAGQDMHQIRDALPSSPGTRRMTIDDAVYLSASVMLPLLKNIHLVGIVHRDVKPSNVVCSDAKQGTEGGEKQFCLVDFGLSKSIVVSKDSPQADSKLPWPPNQAWLNLDQEPHQPDSKAVIAPACIRLPRERSEFRGTSMYASLRVHQCWDYSFRDDIWSLVYVFCDMVSGGLPWMSHAAHRDRAACQHLKELVHGPDGTVGQDQTALLLMGDAYHVAAFKREQQLAKGAEKDKETVELPEPLALCRDEKRVGLLREIFVHLSTLGFGDMPDYDLVERCLRGFADDDPIKSSLPAIPPINWNAVTDPPKFKSRGFRPMLGTDKTAPQWNLVDDAPSVDTSIFQKVEESDSEKKLDRLATLPLEFRFRLKQMEYHASQPETVPPHVALRDWFNVVAPLLYGDWDAARYEGGNRTSTDGMRRDLYLDLLRRCDEWLKLFGNFRQPACFYMIEDASGEQDGRSESSGTKSVHKRRKVETERGASNVFVNVSRAIRGLQCKIQDERMKRPAPGQRLSFGR